MTDTVTANPAVSDAPIVVSATAVPAIVQSIGAALLILIGAIPALQAVFGSHDLVKIVTYLSGQGFAPVLGALGVLGTVGWRVWQAWKSHSNKVTMARAVDNSIAYVAGDPGAPTPGSAVPIQPTKAG